MEFHRIRREMVAKCNPNLGHEAILEMENAIVITQNIDGLHQRAGSKTVVELHGSLWRDRCNRCGIERKLNPRENYNLRCDCGKYFRPDIVWFGDPLKENIINQAVNLIQNCQVFISVGTSGLVWPAAGFPELARRAGIYSIEINPEPTNISHLFDERIQDKASVAIPKLVKRLKQNKL